MLVPFLRELADSIEANKSSPSQLQSVGEFYMRYQFANALKDPVDMEEMMKFLAVGWYYYTVLLKDNSKTHGQQDVD